MATKDKKVSIVEQVTANREAEATKNAEKAVIESRIDRKALLKASFQYSGPMAVNMDHIKPGHQPQWVHDDGEEIEKYLSLGFSHVENTKGEKISVVAFKTGDKKGLRAYLLQAPQDLMDEIEEIRHEAAQAPLGELNKSSNPAFPELGLRFIK